MSECSRRCRLRRRGSRRRCSVGGGGVILGVPVGCGEMRRPGRRRRDRHRRAMGVRGPSRRPKGSGSRRTCRRAAAAARHRGPRPRPPRPRRDGHACTGIQGSHRGVRVATTLRGGPGRPGRVSEESQAAGDFLVAMDDQRTPASHQPDSSDIPASSRSILPGSTFRRSRQTHAAPARPRRGSRARHLLAVSLLSATLASTGTAAVLVGTQLVTAPAATGASDGRAITTGSAGNADGDITDVVAAARDSVVTITADGMAPSRFSPFQVPTTGVGSGVILTSNGYILTNRHVVEDSQSLTVAFSDGSELPARIVHDLRRDGPRADQGRCDRPSTLRPSATRPPRSRPDRHRDRQPARQLHRDGDPGHRLRPRPRDHRHGPGDAPADDARAA